MVVVVVVVVIVLGAVLGAVVGALRRGGAGMVRAILEVANRVRYK